MSSLLKLIPMSLPYRMLRQDDRRISVFVYVGRLGNRIHNGMITVGAALSVIRFVSVPRNIKYQASLPLTMTGRYTNTHLQTDLPARKKMSRYLSDQLRTFGDSIAVADFVRPEYTGMRCPVDLFINTHDLIAIRLLSKALKVKQWELISMLLDGGITTVPSPREERFAGRHLRREQRLNQTRTGDTVQE